jgi:polyphosphate kinase
MPKSEAKTKEVDAVDFDDPKLYINRELSLLHFFRRVLEEAQDEGNPLLERVKFIAIVGSIIDEFFMVRVAGLKQQVAANVVDLSIDGQMPAEQLAAVRKEAAALLLDARRCLQDILPKLDEAGIHILNYADLDDNQKARVDEYFNEVVFPVLTPLAVDPGRPWPHISNLSLNLAVLVRDKKGLPRFARVKVPSTLPRLLPIKRSSGSVRKDGTVPHHHYFTWLEQVIAAHLDKLFPGMEIVEAHPFRVTRDADIVIQELEAADLLETMEAGVRQRRFGSVVRVSFNDSMPAHIRDILVQNMELDANDVYVVDGPLGLADLLNLHAVDRYDLKDTPFTPSLPPALSDHRIDGDIFAAIRARDILIHHPYDSFVPVVDFIRQAARDPDVLAIKMTLYRVGRNSPVLDALLEASENGKQVAVLVELKARFDEESNIEWARTLEAEGVHVVYGLVGLKTHAKVALVVRREGESLRRYVHMASGNYNAVTAQLYTDVGLFTCDEDIGADATDLFNHLTGYSSKDDYRKLLVAPINLRARMEELIRREMKHAQKDEPARLIFKMNALVDKPMIQLLYQASQAGVQIDLLVRGMCCLRPGVPGVSDNICVTSIVGRFLEHSRIYYFENGGKEQVYMGSADLMPRNIDRRVENLFPLRDPEMIRYVRDTVLETYLSDNVKARRLLADGTYERVKAGAKQQSLNSQAWLANNRPAVKK